MRRTSSKKEKRLQEELSYRMSRIYRDTASFLWDDMISSLEQVLNSASDSQLIGCDTISLIYEIDGDYLYRSNLAEVGLDTISLGKRRRLGSLVEMQKPMMLFKDRVVQSEYFLTEWFNVEELFKAGRERQIYLDFLFSEVSLPKRRKGEKYKIAITTE